MAGVDADPVVLAKANKKARRGGVELAFHEALSTALEIVRILRPRGRLVVGDVGRPQGAAMRLAVLATVQLLDGVATTSLNVAGLLPAVLSEAGLRDVVVTDRLRTPTGTVEIITGTRA